MSLMTGALQQDLFGGVVVRLTSPERVLMRRTIAGAQTTGEGSWGGWQSLARVFQLREQESANGVFEVNEEELVRAYRYASAHGNGTYETNYFRPIVAAALRAGWRPSAALEAEVEARRLEVKSRR